MPIHTRRAALGVHGWQVCVDAHRHVCRHACGHVCGHVCRHMCWHGCWSSTAWHPDDGCNQERRYVCADVCVDMCMNMRAGMWLGMCAYVCVDVRFEMHTDMDVCAMCTNARAGMCADVCVDVVSGVWAGMCSTAPCSTHFKGRRPGRFAVGIADGMSTARVDVGRYSK